MVCDFVCDEAEGILDEGIVPGSRRADVLDSWACRDCGAPQSDFAMVAA